MIATATLNPHLWFDRHAHEAALFYCSVFPRSAIHQVTTLHDTPSGDCEVVDFELLGQRFQAISAGPLFKFNESISFVVHCDTQDEIDHYWQALSAVPESEACGWLKDRYGLSWQIVPRALGRYMTSGDAALVARITRAFLQMKKFDIAALAAAANP